MTGQDQGDGRGGMAFCMKCQSTLSERAIADEICPNCGCPPWPPGHGPKDKPFAVSEETQRQVKELESKLASAESRAQEGAERRVNAWVALNTTAKQSAQDGGEAWIPCSERMPDDDQQVLVWTESGHIAEDWVDKDTGDFLNYGDDVKVAGCRATHWRPLDADAPPEVREAVHELIVKAHAQLADKPCEFDRLKAQRDAMEARDVERMAKAMYAHHCAVYPSTYTWDDLALTHEKTRAHWRDMAKAALAAVGEGRANG